MDIIKSFIHKILRLAVIFLALFSLSGVCLAANNSNDVVVAMHDNYFSPVTLVVRVGQKVTWVNQGRKVHTVAIRGTDFDSGRVRPGATASYTFTKPGTYQYKCKLHSMLFMGMKGTIVVK